MNVDEEFKKVLEDMDEGERRELEQKLSSADEETREFAKIYLIVAKAFRDYEEEKERKILECLNKEELEKVSKEELVITVHDLVWQACGDDKGNVDSRALSIYAGAMRLLARLGLLEIDSEYGRRVIGKLKPVEEL